MTADGPFSPELNKLYDVSLQAYLEAPGLSKSGLDKIEDCPLEFKRGEKGQTDSMALGSLIHCLALEPDRFDDRYVPEPDPAKFEGKVPRATKAYKEAFAQIEAEYPNHEIIHLDDLQHAQALAKAVRTSGVFEKLMGGEPLCERSIWFEELAFDEDLDEQVPVLCKARPDAHFERERNVVCVDLKKARDAHPRKFSADSARFRYHLSAYLTSRALEEVYGKPVTWIAFVVEAKPPYKVATYRYNTTAKMVGQAEAHRNMTTWLACERSGKWPGYNGGKLADIEIPYWLQKRVEDERAESNPEPF